MAQIDESLIYAIDQQIGSIETVMAHMTPQSDEWWAMSMFIIELRERSNEASQSTPANDSYENESEPPSAKRARTKKPVPHDECVACLDEFPRPEMHLLNSCKHRYCHNCFLVMIRGALERVELARCCGHHVRPTEALKKIHQNVCDRYEKSFKELTAENAMYCGVLSCGAYIGNHKRQLLKRFVTCKKCQSASCASCRHSVADHKGPQKVCPLDDPTVQQAIQEYNMQQCPNCFAVVEKNGGCNNVTCKCGTMFCYVCGDKKRGERSSCTCVTTRRQGCLNDLTAATPVNIGLPNQPNVNHNWERYGLETVQPPADANAAVAQPIVAARAVTPLAFAVPAANSPVKTPRSVYFRGVRPQTPETRAVSRVECQAVLGTVGRTTRSMYAGRSIPKTPCTCLDCVRILGSRVRLRRNV